MEEKNLQEPEKKVTLKVPKKESYQLNEVPSNFQRVVTLGDQVVDADELLVKIANAVKNAGLDLE